MQRLSHIQGICRIHDFGICADSIMLVMTKYRCSLREWRHRQPDNCRHQLRLYLHVFAQVAKLLQVQLCCACVAHAPCESSQALLCIGYVRLEFRFKVCSECLHKAGLRRHVWQHLHMKPIDYPSIQSYISATATLLNQLRSATHKHTHLDTNSLHYVWCTFCVAGYSRSRDCAL